MALLMTMLLLSVLSQYLIWRPKSLFELHSLDIFTALYTVTVKTNVIWWDTVTSPPPPIPLPTSHTVLDIWSCTDRHCSVRKSNGTHFFNCNFNLRNFHENGQNCPSEKRKHEFCIWRHFVDYSTQLVELYS